MSLQEQLLHRYYSFCCGLVKMVIKMIVQDVVIDAIVVPIFPSHCLENEMGLIFSYEWLSLNQYSGAAYYHLKVSLEYPVLEYPAAYYVDIP